MKRSGQKVVVVGAGAAGLSVGIGLAQDGHDVTILERRSAALLRQSGAAAAPERLCESTGRYPQERHAAQEMLRESESFRRRLPEAVVEVAARYFVPDLAAHSANYGEDLNDRSPVSPAFRRTHALRTYQLQDRLIDAEMLSQTLSDGLVRAGGRMISSAEVVGSRRLENHVATVFARTPYGLQRFSSDVVINAAGSRLQQVVYRIGSGAGIAEYMKLSATPVLRFPWPFSIEPAILQFFGPPNAPVLKNLRVTPLGRTRDALVTTSSSIPIDDPDQIVEDLQAARRELLHLMATGFDLLDLPEPHAMAWTVKARPVQNELESVLSGATIGGAENEFLCLPGKLRSVLNLRCIVSAAVEEFFESQGRLVAA